MHKYNIQYIVDHGTQEEMEELKEVMDDVICELKVLDHTAYLHYEYKLHKLAHHGHVGEALARKWTGKMKNKDGTHGAHWTVEQTEQVKKDKGLHYDMWDFYTALNMMYSDYFSSRFDVNTYIELAKDWLDDVDVGENKLLKYYYFVACK